MLMSLNEPNFCDINNLLCSVMVSVVISSAISKGDIYIYIVLFIIP